MSYGVAGPKVPSKKALRELVAAGDVLVFDTSAFSNRGTVSIAELADTSAVIVGPDVYTDRRWYANVKRDKSGNIKIV
jgi:hypothetical protein